MRGLVLIVLAVAGLSWSFSAWLYVSAVRGEPEWSRSLVGPPVAVSMLAACVAALVIAVRSGGRQPDRPPIVIVAAGLLCVAFLVVQFLADWRSTQPAIGGAIGGDPGDRYLHSHSRRIRGITEEEYRRHDAANWRASTAIEVVFASLGLALALQAWLMKRPAPEVAGHTADPTPSSAGGGRAP